jgi:hypothetical protein
MATEYQIRTDRVPVAKSTGPITPEGTRPSSQSAAGHSLVSGTVVLKRESVQRLDLEMFRARNSAFSAGSGVLIDVPRQRATETSDDDSQSKPNFASDPGKDPTCNEQVPRTTPHAAIFLTNPISPSATTIAEETPSRSLRGFEAPDRPPFLTLSFLRIL